MSSILDWPPLPGPLLQRRRGGRARRHGRPIGARRAELGLELAVPFDNGGFGDAELAADAGKAETADAEAAKFVSGVLGVHMFESSTPLLIDGGEN